MDNEEDYLEGERGAYGDSVDYEYAVEERDDLGTGHIDNSEG